MNYTTLATKENIERTMAALTSNGIHPIFVEDESQALEKIKSMIPAGASVMNGSSVTLETIGFIDYLKSPIHGWNNLHEGIVSEKDPIKQSALRKQALLSEYYLGSVHALTEGGEFLVASNTGSQQSHIVFSSKNVIFVVGAQKIVPTINDAFKRLYDHVVPLEDEHSMKKWGVGTYPSKIVVFKKENPHLQRNVHMIIVNKSLGF